MHWQTRTQADHPIVRQIGWLVSLPNQIVILKSHPYYRIISKHRPPVSVIRFSLRLFVQSSFSFSERKLPLCSSNQPLTRSHPLPFNQRPSSFGIKSALLPRWWTNIQTPQGRRKSGQIIHLPKIHFRYSCHSHTVSAISSFDNQRKKPWKRKTKKKLKKEHLNIYIYIYVCVCVCVCVVCKWERWMCEVKARIYLEN